MQVGLKVDFLFELEGFIFGIKDVEVGALRVGRVTEATFRLLRLVLLDFLRGRFESCKVQRSEGLESCL